MGYICTYDVTLKIFPIIFFCDIFFQKVEQVTKVERGKASFLPREKKIKENLNII